MRHVRSRPFAAVLAAMAVLAAAAPAETVLPDAERTNGAATLKALAGVQQRAAASTVLVGSDTDRSLLGLVVSADGYLVTQASDTQPLRPLRVFLSDGSAAEVREVKRDDRLNLLLLKVDRTGLQPVAWAGSARLPIGQWLCALSGHGREIRLGVVSAKRRFITNSGAVLGVRFGDDDGVEGVAIEELAEDSPARQAGLLVNDIILGVDDVAIPGTASLRKAIGAHQPGDVVTVRYSRDGKEASCKVRLASRRHVQMNWDGGDFANHGTSLRTDNFPDVLQHDLPLDPADMGGALYDLEGRAVGLNIARVDRVTNFALPVEAFLPEVTRWIEEDRAKR